MNENRYESPKSNLKTDDGAAIEISSAKKVFIFLFMLIIGGLGLLMSGCGVALVSFTGGVSLLSLIPASLFFFFMYRGIKAALKKDKESSKSLIKLYWGCVILFVILAFFCIFFFLL